MVPERSDRETQAVNGEEFDIALDRAEDMLARVDRGRQAVNRYLVLTALGWAASAIAVALVFAGSSDAASIAIAATVAMLANVALSVSVRALLVRPLRKSVDRDERLAVETINLLRELLPLLSRQDRWNRFRTEQTRVRIARFGITVRKAR